MKRASPNGILALSLLGISFGGPLVRLSNSDPVVIAAGRLAFSLVIVGVALALTGEWRDWKRLTTRDAALAIAAGIALALHFWAWNASIHLTTIAASVTLVNLQPAFIVAISVIFLGDLPVRRQVFGIILALTGAAIIAVPALTESGASARPAAPFGNILAVSAALTAAVYYSIGRLLRGRYGLWSYVGLAYTACFLTLVGVALVTHATLAPQPSHEIGIFVALALGPMLLGHTGMNWALKFLPAYVVNLVTLGEPFGATLLGAMIPGIREIPSILTVAGGVVVLAGVTIAVRTTVSSRPARS